MTSRRTFMKIGVGSLSVALTLPGISAHASDSRSLHPIIVFNENDAESAEFARSALARGGEPFPIGQILEPARKAQLYRRLLRRPSLVIGLTDPVSAFELRMAANDAFHFDLPGEQFAIEGNAEGSLVAWAMAPVAEIIKG